MARTRTRCTAKSVYRGRTACVHTISGRPAECPTTCFGGGGGGGGRGNALGARGGGDAVQWHTPSAISPAGARQGGVRGKEKQRGTCSDVKGIEGRNEAGPGGGGDWVRGGAESGGCRVRVGGVSRAFRGGVAGVSGGVACVSGGCRVRFGCPLGAGRARVGCVSGASRLCPALQSLWTALHARCVPA